MPRAARPWWPLFFSLFIKCGALPVRLFFILMQLATTEQRRGIRITGRAARRSPLAILTLLVGLLALVSLAPLAASSAEQGAITYYVQLIRGSDEDTPPEPGSKRVGPKLAETFKPVFKWKTYWEIKCREVALTPGRATRVRLNDEREVHLDLTDPNHRKVAAFQKGALVERTVSPLGEGMTIIGGDRDKKSAWFIVVRRDKPKP